MQQKYFCMKQIIIIIIIREYEVEYNTECIVAVTYRMHGEADTSVCFAVF